MTNSALINYTQNTQTAFNNHGDGEKLHSLMLLFGTDASTSFSFPIRYVCTYIFGLGSKNTGNSFGFKLHLHTSKQYDLIGLSLSFFFNEQDNTKSISLDWSYTSLLCSFEQLFWSLALPYNLNQSLIMFSSLSVSSSFLVRSLLLFSSLCTCTFFASVEKKREAKKVECISYEDIASDRKRKRVNQVAWSNLMNQHDLYI